VADRHFVDHIFVCFVAKAGLCGGMNVALRVNAVGIAHPVIEDSLRDREFGVIAMMDSEHDVQVGDLDVRSPVTMGIVIDVEGFA
jgi:hypothetical protein